MFHSWPFVPLETFRSPEYPSVVIQHEHLHVTTCTDVLIGNDGRCLA